jgi:hypothetical protein
VPSERAATLTIPTLIMDGGASEMIMPFMRATAEALTTAIPHAKHQILCPARRTTWVQRRSRRY